MTDWLRTSIPGVIILGAVGSVLAVFLLRLSATLTRRFLRPTFDSVQGRLFVALRSQEYVISQLRSAGDIHQLLVTCTFLLAGFTLHTSVVAIGVLGLALGATLGLMSSQRPSGVMLVVAFLGSFLTCTEMFLVRRWAALITRLYRLYMREVDEQAVARANEELERRASWNETSELGHIRRGRFQMSLWPLVAIVGAMFLIFVLVYMGRK